MREVLTPEEIFAIGHNELDYVHTTPHSQRILDRFLRENEGLFKRIAKAQLAKLLKHRSPELVAGIKTALRDEVTIDEQIVTHRLDEWHCRTGQLHEADVERITAELLLLYPDEEAIKREERERIGHEIANRGQAGMDALPNGEQGFWKGYWQSQIDMGQALKGE